MIYVSNHPAWNHMMRQMRNAYTHYVPAEHGCWFGLGPNEDSKTPWIFGPFDVHKDLGASPTMPPDLGTLDFHVVSQFLHEIPRVNQPHILLSLSEIQASRFFVWGLFGVGNKIFCRPNSADKTFTGFLWDITENIRFVEDIPPHTLCVVSRPVKIMGEWRFFTADDEILSGCCYMFGGEHVEIPSWPEAAAVLVKKILAKLPKTQKYQAIDVAQVGDEFFFLEMNAVGTSSPYKSDMVSVTNRMLRT